MSKNTVITEQPRHLDKNDEEAILTCVEAVGRGVVGTVCFASTIACAGAGFPAVPAVIAPATLVGCVGGSLVGFFRVAANCVIDECLKNEPTAHS